MRAWLALSAVVLMFGMTNAVSAQSSSSPGGISLGSFMSRPSIFSNAATGSRPSMMPFTGLTSATRLVPSFPSFQFPMMQRTPTAPTVRYLSFSPPAKK